MRLRSALLTAATLLLFATAARTCGPDFPEAIFVLTTGPDGSYANFAAGHIGIPQTNYRTRHLVLAYNYLTHRSLTPDEQQQAIAANETFTEDWYYEQQQKKHSPPSGFDTWIAARASFGPVDNYTPPADLATSQEINYTDIPTCLDDAFATATKTLSARLAAHTKQDPGLTDWVRGQDAVFSNCGDGKPRPFFGPGTPPPPPPVPHAPATLPANAPLWLQQDRAYQLAAANFYAAKYDNALKGFRNIAADTASPWSPIADYLIARTLIRRAQPPPQDYSAPRPTQNQIDDAHDASIHTFILAREHLLALQSNPRMAPLQPAIANLIDYVSLRIDPNAQAIVLANRLHGPSNTTRPNQFGQALIDLTWIRTNHDDPTAQTPPNTPTPGDNDLLAWIDDFSTLEHIADPKDIAAAKADILKHWHATPTSPWLFAALASAIPTDPTTPELLRAAAILPPTDPGYTAITYHRLRLSPHSSTTRADLFRILPLLDKPESASTHNLFATLNAATAPTLNEWLATAGRKPAEESFGYFINNEDSVMPQSEDVCGTKIPSHSTQLFDLDAAVALNRQIPLRILAQAAESTTLPTDLRYQVAQATWARAVLLDQPTIARRMTPLLIACRAAWKPVLTAYDATQSTEARHAAGLFALMRFASTEPSVRQGEERRQGFASYDEFRQNWWCTTVPAPGLTVDYSPNSYYHPPTVPEPAPPIFLTPAELAEAAAEVAALDRIPTAGIYFAQQALAWMKLHPTDPQTPELLGQADRVVRNSCRTERPFDTSTGKPTGDLNDPNLTPNLAHALFDALHTRYPTSPWTKRYKSWQ